MNATRRALLCPILWASRNGFVQITKAAKPLSEMMSQDEYVDVVDVRGSILRKRSPSLVREPPDDVRGVRAAASRGQGAAAAEEPALARTPAQ